MTSERRPARAPLLADEAAFILAQPTDGFRARRIRRWARRELDAVLDPFDPWTYAAPVGDPDWWSASHMNRTVGDREAIGADLAAAGWCP